MSEAEVQERMIREMRTLITEIEAGGPVSNRLFANTVRRHAFNRILAEESGRPFSEVHP